jgi:hypothetical protein
VLHDTSGEQGRARRISRRYICIWQEQYIDRNQQRSLQAADGTCGQSQKLMLENFSPSTLDDGKARSKSAMLSREVPCTRLGRSGREVSAAEGSHDHLRRDTRAGWPPPAHSQADCGCRRRCSASTATRWQLARGTTAVHTLFVSGRMQCITLVESRYVNSTALFARFRGPGVIQAGRSPSQRRAISLPLP